MGFIPVNRFKLWVLLYNFIDTSYILLTMYMCMYAHIQVLCVGLWIPYLLRGSADRWRTLWTGQEGTAVSGWLQGRAQW